MYRHNIDLEIIDWKLRIYVEYCKALPKMYERLKDISDEIKFFGYPKKSILSKNQNYYSVSTEDELLDLIGKKDNYLKIYNEYLVFIRSINKILRIINPEDIYILSLRYEKGLTFRKIGDILHYSYMNVSRDIDRILYNFVEFY